MENFNIELTLQETAVIATECSLSLSDNRCSDPKQRAVLEGIIAKMAAPVGVEIDLLRLLTDAMVQMKGQSVSTN